MSIKLYRVIRSRRPLGRWWAWSGIELRKAGNPLRNRLSFRPMANTAIWIVLFALGLLGLTWPILEIFHENTFLYLLIFWLGFILLLALATRGTRPPPPPGR